VFGIFWGLGLGLCQGYWVHGSGFAVGRKSSAARAALDLKDAAALSPCAYQPLLATP